MPMLSVWFPPLLPTLEKQQWVRLSVMYRKSSETPGDHGSNRRHGPEEVAVRDSRSAIEMLRMCRTEGESGQRGEVVVGQIVV